VRPFDLEKDVLFRIKIWEQAEDSFLLLINIHHIIADEWSFRIMSSEIEAAYNGGEEPAKALGEPLRIQYKDYASWSNEALTSEAFEAHKSYWLEQFSGEIPKLELPIDFPRPSIQTFSGDALQKVLSQPTGAALRHLATERKTSLFSILSTIVSAWLSRISGQKDIVLGTPIAGRNHFELQNQIGFYTNTLALRTQLDGSESFYDLMDKVQQTVLDAFEHQDYPFDKMVEALQLQRDLSRSPLFDVWVQLIEQETDVSNGLQLTGAEATPFDMGIATTKFDLSFYFQESPEGLQLRIEFNTRLFKPQTIQRLMDYFEYFLQAMLEQPENRISHLPIFSAEEQQQVIELYTGPAVDNPTGTYIELFEEQVQKTPQNTALQYQYQSYTYAELNEEANRLAHWLSVQQPNQKAATIGLLMDRSDAYIIGMLAILKTGGAFLPLDKSLPAERIQYMLDKAEVSAILCKDVELSSSFDCPVLSWNPEAWKSMPTRNLEVTYDIDDLAYVLFTSGTTGRPKGAMIEHRGMMNHLFAKIRDFEIDETSVVAQNASISFDISIWQGLVALLCGACTRVYSQELVLEPERFMAAVGLDDISVLEVVPSYLSEMLAIVDGSKEACGLESLSHLIATGETLKKKQVERWFEHFPSIPLGNVYGPTEASDDITHLILTEVPQTPNISIGRPIQNLQVYILNADDQLCPIGVRGEICVAGPGVGRGYIGEEEKTAAVFVDDPFCTLGSCRMYRTGDIGCYREDGSIEFMGRKDHQVKVRGHRIELGEIEEQLVRIHGIEEGVVLLDRGANDQGRLVAFLSVSENAKVEAAGIKARLAEQLPAYMVPSQVQLLDQIPHTNAGKIDRQALALLPLEQPEDLPIQAPRTEEEWALANIWKELLGVREVGIDQNFFELGGDSLKVMRLQLKLRRDWDVNISFHDFVLRYPSIRQLAAKLNDQPKTKLPAIRPLADAADYAPSFAQQRLWAITHFSPEQRAYNISGSFRIEGKMQTDLFEQAFWILENRHESLRTNFREINGVLRQQIHPIGCRRLKLQTKDVRHKSAEQMERACKNAFARPYDLAQDPLVRSRLWQTGEEEYILFLSMHHIISDALSLDILMRELSENYDALLQGKEVERPSLTVQYRDFSAWQRALLDKGELDGQRNYWQAQFSDSIPSLDLPTDFRRPAYQTYDGKQLEKLLNERSISRLSRLCQANGCTLFMGLTALTKVFLSKISHEKDLVIGTPVAGRPLPALQEQIGLYVNTLALRTQQNESDSFVDYLLHCRQKLSEALVNSDYPFDQLVEQLPIQRDFSRNPLFDIWIQYITASFTAENDLQLRGTKITPLQTEEESSKFDLSFFFVEREEGLALKVEYNTDLFRQQTIDSYLHYFDHLLQEVLQTPEQKIEDISLITEPEAALLVQQSSGPSMDVSPESFPALFKKQAAKTPKHEAIRCGDKSYTYAELDILTDILAADISQQFEPRLEEPIGLMIHRSEWYIIGILAIQKAGGAFIPIDASLPEERIRYMLEQAGARLLLYADASPLANLDCEQYELTPTPDVWETSPATYQELTAQSLSYVLFTSGSTGRPKGAMLEHGGMVNHQLDKIREFALDENCRIAHTASVSFDISIWQALTALLCGGCCVVYTDEIVRNPARLIDQLQADQITLMETVPSYLGALIEELKKRKGADRELSLTHLLSIGEVLKKSLVQRWFDVMPNTPLVNTYGPTEASDTITHHAMQQCPAGDRIPVGRAIRNTNVYVMDDQGRICPIGVKGEICVAGPGVGRGYINQPEQTSRSFGT
ncbi:MAG: amino acid adenylation domain-containing protein, partial [Bacteroidota bacterium]